MEITKEFIKDDLAVSELVKEIKEKRIEISFSNGRLKFSGPEQYIDKELIRKLTFFKAKLLKYYWPKDCPNMMPINTEGNKIPFILVHGGPANYPLSEYFSVDQPFYGYFYIGSEGEKIKYKSVESFSKEYKNQLQKILPEGPYILGGLSFGGILAFEMAIQLQNQGFEVPFLILVDCEVPSLVKNSEDGRFQKGLYSLLYNRLKLVYHWFYFNTRNMLYGLFEIFNIKLPVSYRNSYIRWNYYKLMKIYKPSVQFNGEVLLFRTEANPSLNEYLGWDLLCNNIQLEMLGGDHTSMYVDKDSISVFQKRISEILNNINARNRR